MTKHKYMSYSQYINSVVSDSKNKVPELESLLKIHQMDSLDDRIQTDSALSAFEVFHCSCQKCGDTGVFKANEKNSIYSAIFKCTCKFGAARKERFPFWNSTHFHRYEPEFWTI